MQPAMTGSTEDGGEGGPVCRRAALLLGGHYGGRSSSLPLPSGGSPCRRIWVDGGGSGRRNGGVRLIGVMGEWRGLGFGTPYGLWLHRKHHTSQEEPDLTFENLTRSNTEAPGEGNIRSNTEAPGEGNTRPNTEIPEEGDLRPNTEAPEEGNTNLNILPVSTMNAFLKMNKDIVKTEKKDLEAGKRGWHSTSELIKGRKVNHVALSLQDCSPSLRNSFRDFCSEWQRFANPRLSEMVFLCGEDEEHNLDKEYLHAYKYEGKDSPTGSLSSCTGESEEEKLSFLNQPEPPFRTLVEVFIKKDCV